MLIVGSTMRIKKKERKIVEGFFRNTCQNIWCDNSSTIIYSIQFTKRVLHVMGTIWVERNQRVFTKNVRIIKTYSLQHLNQSLLSSFIVLESVTQATWRENLTWTLSSCGSCVLQRIGLAGYDQQCNSVMNTIEVTNYFLFWFKVCVIGWNTDLILISVLGT